MVVYNGLQQLQHYQTPFHHLVNPPILGNEGFLLFYRAFLQKGWDTLPLLTREDEHSVVRQNDTHQILSCAFWVFHNTSHVW